MLLDDDYAIVDLVICGIADRCTAYGQDTILHGGG